MNKDFDNGIDLKLQQYIDTYINSKLEENNINQKKLVDEVFEKIRVGGLGNNSIYLDSKEGFYVGNKLSSLAPTRIAPNGDITSHSLTAQINTNLAVNAIYTYTVLRRTRYILVNASFNDGTYKGIANGHASNGNAGQYTGMIIDLAGGAIDNIAGNAFLAKDGARGNAYCYVNDWRATEVDLKVFNTVGNTFICNLLFIA